jgi:hypothetical protein
MFLLLYVYDVCSLCVSMSVLEGETVDWGSGARKRGWGWGRVCIHVCMCANIGAQLVYAFVYVCVCLLCGNVRVLL